MKKLILLLGILTIVSISNAQTIMNITMSPAAPDDNDSITFYVELQFPYYSSGSSMVSSSPPTVYGVGSYCMGMLTMIHDKTDTLKIGPQPAGSYSFIYVLSAGVGGPPCSPPFVPNDQDTLLFTVATSTGIVESGKSDFSVFPNPSNGTLTIKGAMQGEEFKLFDLSGQLVQTIVYQNEQMVMNVAEGIYYLRSEKSGITQKISLLK